MREAGTPEQIAALYAALGQAQAEFPKIEKTKSAYNYKYAPMDEIEEKIRPILVKHGLTVLHPIDHVNGKQAVGTLVTHVLGGRIACDGLIIQEGIKMQDQGGHVTYGRRYGYCAMLGITSQDDDDAAVSSSGAKSPRRGAASSTPRRDAVAQPVGRAPLAAARAATPVQPSGDSGSSPDPSLPLPTKETRLAYVPSLPTKEERLAYVGQLSKYRKQVTDDALRGFLLRESGAPETRLIEKRDWIRMLAQLDEALAKGNLLEAVGANFNR